MATNNASTVTNDQLVSELWARDVPFLLGEQLSPTPLLSPEKLIQFLSASDEARLRMALIPLLLRHPEFSPEAKSADEALSGRNSQLYLRFYYTAAVILQKKYQARLSRIFGNQKLLPDFFSHLLGVEINQDPPQSLLQLSRQHQILSSQAVNWLETYEHSAERFIKQMEKSG